MLCNDTGNWTDVESANLETIRKVCGFVRRPVSSFYREELRPKRLNDFSRSLGYQEHTEDDNFHFPPSCQGSLVDISLKSEKGFIKEKRQGNFEIKYASCPCWNQMKRESSKGIWKFCLTSTRAPAHFSPSSEVTGTPPSWAPLPFTCAISKNAILQGGRSSYNKRRSQPSLSAGVAGRRASFSLPAINCGAKN